jgi:hypothetical protein
VVAFEKVRLKMAVRMERRQLVEETGGELKRFPQLTFQAFV